MFILLTKLCKWTYEYNKCPGLFQNFWDWIFIKDFSRPKNNHFLNSMTFACFSMNPVKLKKKDITLTQNGEPIRELISD